MKRGLDTESLYLGGISRRKAEAKDWAVAQDFTFAPIVSEGGRIVAYAISNEAYTAYQKEYGHPFTLRPVVSNDFFLHHDDVLRFAQYDANEALAVTIGQYGKRPAATFIVLSPKQYEDLKPLPDNIAPDVPAIRGTSVISRTRTHLGRLPDRQVKNVIEFKQQITDICEAISGGYLCMRGDFKLAATTHDWALRLKERTHNGSGQVIQDISVGDLKNLTNEDLIPVITGHRFLRVFQHGPQGQRLDERFTLFSADLAEYFDIDDDGKITGIVTKGGFDYHLNYETILRSNFVDTTKIKLLLEERQNRTLIGRHVQRDEAAIVRRALHRLQDTQKALYLMGQAYRVAGHKTITTKERGKFSLTSDMPARIQLKLDDKRNPCTMYFDFDRQNDMGAMAATQTRSVNLQVNGSQFRLEPLG